MVCWSSFSSSQKTLRWQISNVYPACNLRLWTQFEGIKATCYSVRVPIFRQCSHICHKMTYLAGNDKERPLWGVESRGSCGLWGEMCRRGHAASQILQMIFRERVWYEMAKAHTHCGGFMCKYVWIIDAWWWWGSLVFRPTRHENSVISAC